MGGFGLQSASRCHPGAHWASWADGIEMTTSTTRTWQVIILTALSLTEALSICECGAIVREANFEMPTWLRTEPDQTNTSIQRISQQIQPSGGRAGQCPLNCSPLHGKRVSIISPFRVPLLRRLRLHLLTVRRCRCGRLLDAFGRCRSACATAGVLETRGHALESAAARVCREAGGRVMTSVLVRELYLSPIHNRLDWT